MTLPREDCLLFYKLHQTFLYFVNQRLEILGKPVRSPAHFAKQSPEDRLHVRNALLEHMELIDAFVAENPFQLPEAELEIVRSWKHLVAGEFYIFRYLKSHTIFLTTGEPVVAYGVLALKDPFESLIGPYLPHLCQAVLLPFKGRIVYDGILTGYNVTFGGGIRRRLNESYTEAKEQFGIVTELPFDPEQAPKASKAIAKKRVARSGKAGSTKELHSILDEIVGLTDAFCEAHLDAGYGALCRELAGVLARKRPSPLNQGRPLSWAAGIVRVIGSVNFLHDPSQPHHMKMSDIDRLMGVSEATGSAKATAIRKLLKIHQFEPEWTHPDKIDQNPLIWMLEVDGLIVDARRMPVEFQEEAYRRGLIPYVFGDPEEDA